MKDTEAEGMVVGSYRVGWEYALGEGMKGKEDREGANYRRQDYTAGLTCSSAIPPNPRVIFILF